MNGHGHEFVHVRGLLRNELGYGCEIFWNIGYGLGFGHRFGYEFQLGSGHAHKVFGTDTSSDSDTDKHRSRVFAHPDSAHLSSAPNISPKKDTYCSYIIQTSPHHNINFTFNDDFFVPCHKSGGVYQSGDYVEDRDPFIVGSVPSGDSLPSGGCSTAVRGSRFRF